MELRRVLPRMELHDSLVEYGRFVTECKERPQHACVDHSRVVRVLARRRSIQQELPVLQELIREALFLEGSKQTSRSLNLSTLRLKIPALPIVGTEPLS